MQYQAGICNIGREEISRRYRIGWIGLLLVVVLISLIEWLDWPRIIRLLVALPLGMSIAGFAQAVRRFCFAYGLRGVSGMQDTGNVQRITAQDALRQDRRTARKLLTFVSGLTILLTFCYFLIP